MPISKANIIRAYHVWDEAMKDKGPKESADKTRSWAFCLRFIEALAVPIFDGQGDSNTCLKRITELASVYLDLVVTEGWPRWAYCERVLLAIKASFPTMPNPRAPTTSRPYAMNTLAIRHCELFSVTMQSVNGCKGIIQRGPPPKTTQQDGGYCVRVQVEGKDFMSCEGAIFAAYKRINAPAYAQKAWQLLKPYLHNKSFVKHLSRILRSEESASNLYALSTVDLLMEAHEITLPPPGLTAAVADFNFNRDNTLLRVLSVDTKAPDLPLSNAQASFLFGIRLDHGLRDTSHLYRQVLQDLLGGQDEWTCAVDDRTLAIGVHMLDLIECVLESRCGASY